jgi:Protein of unknown function (DUF3126)
VDFAWVGCNDGFAVALMRSYKAGPELSGHGAGGSRRIVLKLLKDICTWRRAVDVQEVRKLDAYLKRLFGNPKIRVVPRPKKDDSAEVYIGEEFIGVLFVDDEDDDRSFQFQMAILEDDLVEQG